MHKKHVFNSFPEIVVNSYEYLRDWLISDLGDIQIEPKSASSIFVQYLNQFDLLRNKLTQKESDLLDRLQEIDSALKRNKLSKEDLNQKLQGIFLDAFFARESYTARKMEFTGLTFNFLIKERLKYPNPLPTLDALVALKGDDRQFNQLQRAAILIKVLTEIALEINDGRYDFFLTNEKKANPVAFKYMFGATVSSKLSINTLIRNKNSNHVSLLIAGQVYKIKVLDGKRCKFSADFICDQLGKIVDNLKKTSTKKHYPIGALSAGSRLKCYEVRKALVEKHKGNGKSLDVLEKSLFVVSLDNNAEPLISNSYLEKAYIGNFQNRWYGTTQLVVDSFGQASLILSYSKGASSNVLEFGDEVYRRSLKLQLNEERAQKIGKNVFVKLDFDVVKDDVTLLENEVASFQNKSKSIYKLNIGKNLFKECGYSPNVCLHFLLMLATFENGGSKTFPVANQAVEMALYRNEAIQTDWIYTPIFPIMEFLDLYKQNGRSNEEKYNLFRQLLDSHKLRLQSTKKGLSPTYLLHKPSGEFYVRLCDFFTLIGEFSPAYRNYLFRIHRNPNSIDLMSSSLALPDSLSFVSRPGTLLNTFKNFGVHLMLNENTTTLCFMVNSLWAEKLEKIIESVNSWITRVVMLSGKGEAYD